MLPKPAFKYAKGFKIPFVNDHYLIVTLKFYTVNGYIATIPTACIYGDINDEIYLSESSLPELEKSLTEQMRGLLGNSDADQLIQDLIEDAIDSTAHL